jgi:Chalcone isomerase-like
MQALLVLLALAVIAFVVGGADVIEGSTGHKFNDAIGFPSSALLGAGVRVKQIGPVAAKVYAVGLYSSRDSAVKSCKGCKSAKEVLAKLGDVVQSGTVVLKMSRDVGAETMASALSEAIKPRMGGKDINSCESLRILVAGSLPKGCAKNTILAFACSGGGVGVCVNGQNKGSVSSSTLSKAFMKTYLDEKAVSPSLREKVASNIFDWVSK